MDKRMEEDSKLLHKRTNAVALWVCFLVIAVTALVIGGAISTNIIKDRLEAVEVACGIVEEEVQH